MAYRLTDPARADMRDILLYTLQQWGDAQASRYKTALVAAFERISDTQLHCPAGHARSYCREGVHWQSASISCCIDVWGK